MRIKTFCMYLYKIFVCITTILCINVYYANADVTEEITAIAKDIKNNPQLWSVDQHEFCRYNSIAKAKSKACSSSNPSLLTIWISNGVDFIKINHPYQLQLYEKNRELLWDAYMGWLNEYRHKYVSNNFEEYTKKVFDKDRIKTKEDTQDSVIKFLEGKKEPKKEFLDTTITEEEISLNMCNVFKLIIIILLIAIIWCVLTIIFRGNKRE